jgi:hypothetical protein
MANYEQSFAIRQLALNAVGFTDVQGLAVLPIDCNTIVIYNDSNADIYLRTNPGQASSQVTIAPGQFFSIGGPSQNGGFRFPQNCPPVCSLEASTGTPTVTIESLK